MSALSISASSKDRKASTADNDPPPPVTNLQTGESSHAVAAIAGPQSTPDTCRETLRINSEEQAFHHHLTLGLQEKLQKNRMIRNVKAQFRKPVDKQTLGYWERKNGVILPTDLKEYYQSTNGFKLTWSLEHAGDVLPIGELNINPINQLLEIHQAAKQSGSVGSVGRGNTSSSILMRPKTCASESLPRNAPISGPNSSRRSDDFSNNSTGAVPYSELEQTIAGVTGQSKSPISGLTYNPNNKTFILDSGRSGWGKVCLVYPSPPSSEGVNLMNSPSSGGSRSEDCKSPKLSQKKKSSSTSGVGGSSIPSEPYVEIWFMDPSFQWHYLAPTFTHFYRMLIFHLGLPQWQYRFTPFGLSSWAEQMFWLVAPHLLQPPKLSKFPSMYHGEGLWCTDVSNEAANPNATPNVITNQLFRRKKKDREGKPN